jgi:hypothetical protein
MKVKIKIRKNWGQTNPVTVPHKAKNLYNRKEKHKKKYNFL